MAMLPPLDPTNVTDVVDVTTPLLDCKVEYLDADGVIRRSHSITRRMQEEGCKIDKAMELAPTDHVHILCDMLSKEDQTRNSMLAQELEELQTKQRANAALKAQDKREKEQWLAEADELVTTRLQLWYDGKNAPDEIVDIRESNTPDSPSKKTGTYIDETGNLRRRSTMTAMPDGSLPLPMPLEASQVDVHVIIDHDTSLATAL